MNEDLKLVLIPPEFYADEGTRELDSKYNVQTCPNDYIPSSLCSVELEVTASKFLGFSKLYGRFVGFRKDEIVRYLKNFQVLEYRLDDLSDRNFLRTRRRGIVEILFPTEKLLENQGVRKK